MKILSTQDEQFIIQVSLRDFVKLLGERATYSEVTVMRDGENIDLEIKKLVPGDIIESEFIDSIYVEASNIMDKIKELKHSCSGIKGQTTKLMNLLNDAVPKK